MTLEKPKIKPTIRQAYLSRLVSQTEAYANELTGTLDSINSLIKQKQYIDTTFSALVVTRKHIEKAIQRLKSLTIECFNEWNELFETNPYW